ncbi:glycine cleavage system protein H [Burkholderiales bacterium GJ-E10]|nr:glycine cleavage system protein H [Burkholderiales bacterium GJ-E10]
MNVPTELRYTESHEWARAEADGTVSVGITDFAQDALGDLVYLELPEPGSTFAVGAVAAVVESVKAASDIYSPIAGTVVAVNDALRDQPEALNRDPYGAWLFRLKPDDAAAIGALRDAAAYRKQLDSEK